MFFLRRYIYVFFLSFFASLFINAQTSRLFLLEYDEKDFNIKDEGGLIYISTNQYTTILKDDTSAPALPYIGLNILIGPDESFIGFTSDETEVLLREGITIAPNPTEMFTNESIAPNNSKPLTYVKSIYPDKRIEYTGTHIANGYKFLTFLVCPFKYDNADKKLYLDNHINLNILLKSSKANGQPIDNFIMSAPKQKRGSGFFINEEHKEFLYGKDVINQPTSKSNTAQNYPYRYLIITSDSLKNEFERLAHWKSVKGIKTKVLTVENVCSLDTHTDRSVQLKIKYAIKDYYEPYNNGIMYVLLGGDVNQVPTEMCYIQTTIDHVVKTDLTPADIYYSSFTNMEWDNDHDGFSAELEDNVSIAPDIAITRLPASSSSEANEMINRIIDYEKNANENNWDNSMLLCGVETFSSVFENGRQISDSEKQTNSMCSNYITPYWNGNMFRFYDTYTDDSCLVENYDVTRDNLQQELSKGFSFAFVNTHGYSTYWNMEAGLPYGVSSALELVNPRYTIIATPACLTNKFDINSTSCLGEAFMRNRNGGVLAYYGSSRESIGSGFANTLGIDMLYLGTFYQELFSSSSNCLGDAVLNSKKAFCSNCSTYNSTRWMYFTLNALGDPEMPVFKTVPSVIPNVSVYFNGSDLSCTSGVERPMLCLMSRFDEGNEFYYYNYGHGSPLVNDNVFNQMFGEYSFCLTKKGYLPVFALIGNTVHLQNETFTGRNNVISFHTLIGSNVTNQTSEGGVTIENGSTVITSHNDVTITGGFEVKLGAELEINISNQNQVNL